MGGLGFIHLGFLAAGLAVAVPIVIHLLFRQRARRVEIGTIHFLRLVLRDQARRRKIRRWVLLALRAAAMVLLALFFARPYWNYAGVPGRRSANRRLDRSLGEHGRGRGSIYLVRSIPGAGARDLARAVPTRRDGRSCLLRCRAGSSRPRWPDRSSDQAGTGRHRFHQGSRVGAGQGHRVAAEEPPRVPVDRLAARRGCVPRSPIRGRQMWTWRSSTSAGP